MLNQYSTDGAANFSTLLSFLLLLTVAFCVSKCRSCCNEGWIRFRDLKSGLKIWWTWILCELLRELRSLLVWADRTPSANQCWVVLVLLVYKSVKMGCLDFYQIFLVAIYMCMIICSSLSSVFWCYRYCNLSLYLEYFRGLTHFLLFFLHKWMLF